MTLVEELAEFVASRTYLDLAQSTVKALKIRILDSLACAIGALDAPTALSLRKVQSDVGGAPRCTMISGGKTGPEGATLYNGALVRYLDFNDSFLAKNETCHPSDNFAPILASSEYVDGTGKDLLVSLAVAYQVQCRLSEVAPVRAKGFDHTVQGEYGVSAGASRALGLDSEQTANAISISGTALNALRVTRTGKLSNWKGLAFPFMASGAVKATFLAKEGITGPLEVFEGNKGFMDSISGQFSKIDWSSEGLDLVEKTILKSYNAEVHSQSAIACMLKLRNRQGLSSDDVDDIEVRIFDVAYHIIGGGEEGEKKESIKTKEQADHSLPYILAAALLDGRVMPAEYESERINSQDVQELLKKIHVIPDKEFSAKFPAEMPVEITAHTKSGKTLVESSIDYDGFTSRPFTWNEAVNKFDVLTIGYVEKDFRAEIQKVVASLDGRPVRELTVLLEKTHPRKN